MEFVDTHAHAHFDNYGDDALAMLLRAQKVGVKKIITVGVSVEDSKRAVNFAQKYDGVWASVGAHPHDGADFMDDALKSIEQLKQLVDEPKVVAIGEIGLDYYHDHADRQLQKQALKAQLQFAKSTQKPVIFHVRDAWDDFWQVYDEFAPLKGVVHSFSAGKKQLNACIERGLYVALNGIMTFTRDQAQLESAKAVPNDKLLIETDAPFLTPAPFRGKMCEVKHVVDTAEFLSTLRRQSLEELAETTTSNAQNLFGLE